MLDIENINGPDWDEGNSDKNWIKHGVSNSECEEILFNLPRTLAGDKNHSQTEKLNYALGEINDKRRLFIAFTIRENEIRVISARDVSQKESYEKGNPKL